MLPTPPRALVVYESIFGNTKHVAEAVGRGLSSRFEVELQEVSQAPRSLQGFQLVVAGGPIHAFGMTRDLTRREARQQALDRHEPIVSPGMGVREWLAALLPTTEPASAAAFDTGVKLGWFVVGSAAGGIKRALEALDYRVVTAPEHFLVQDLDGPLRDGELTRAFAWGERVATLAQAPAAPPPADDEERVPSTTRLHLLS